MVGRSLRRPGNHIQDCMRRPIRHALSRPFAAALTAFGLGCASVPTAQAGALNITLADQRGVPLADAVALLEPTAGKAAVRPMADVDISQAKRQFTPRVTLITTGTRVNFPNFDTVRHHVYSFSPIKTFELKLYAGVPGVPITFDKPGIAVLGCNIHDSMTAWIVVADTPWSARTSSAGQARIEAIPPGNYRLKLWHAGLPLNTEPPTVALNIGTADTDHSARLPVKAEP
jgi:plastocyanin